MFFNDLVSELKSTGVGVKIGATIICSLLYADDIVLVVKTPVHLQLLLDIILCYNYGKKFHMSFGTDKCEVIVGAEADPAFGSHQWTLGETVLKVVGSYKYLGVEIGGGGVDFQKYIARMEKKFWKRLGTCIGVGAQYDGLRPRRAALLYVMRLRPILEFGAQVLLYPTKIVDKLEALQGQALRKDAGVPSGHKV